MAEIQYVKKAFRPAALRVISQARAICEDYRRQGFDLAALKVAIEPAVRPDLDVVGPAGRLHRDFLPARVGAGKLPTGLEPDADFRAHDFTGPRSLLMVLMMSFRASTTNLSKRRWPSFMSPSPQRAT